MTPCQRGTFDPVTLGHIRGHGCRNLPQLLRLGLVEPQRKHECQLVAGRHAGAVLVSSHGLYSVRVDRRGCAAAAYELTGQDQAVGQL